MIDTDRALFCILNIYLYLPLLWFIYWNFLSFYLFDNPAYHFQLMCVFLVLFLTKDGLFVNRNLFFHKKNLKEDFAILFFTLLTLSTIAIVLF